MAVRWFRDARRLRSAFLAAIVLLGIALAALAWKLLDQDRQLAASQRVVRGQAAADVLVAALQRRLADLQQLGSAAAGQAVPQAAGTVAFRFTRRPLQAITSARLPYRPDLEVATTTDAEAAALVAQAVALRADRRVPEALATYAKLAALGDARIGGLPAALVAQLGRVQTLELSPDSVRAASEARALADDLAASRFALSYASYEYLTGRTKEHLNDTWHPPDLELAADAITRLWDRWIGEGAALGQGWTTDADDSGGWIAIWQASADELSGLAAGPEFIEGTLVAEIEALAAARGVGVSLLAPGAPPQAAPGDAPAWTRTAAETGLPWSLQVVSLGDRDPELAARRRTLIASLSVLATLALAGLIVVGRAVTRELEVARLKSEFVTTVSHEFRTPLTTMCQLSELLAKGRVASADDRRQYYDLLQAESERLRRLVEGLLSFGRLEHGRVNLRTRQLDVEALVQSCLADFRTSRDLSKYPITVERPGAVPHVSGDPDALRSVIWNLLENAVNYSPNGGPIEVRLASSDAGVHVSVRDSGVGIPPREQGRVFAPFTRGSEAIERGIRGTGIGLALAREIARAHGGDLDVSSEPGRGSTFTLHLPAWAGDQA